MSRRSFHGLVPAALAVLAVLGGSGCGDGARRPCVALFLVDTLRADALGCYGSPVPASPELDDLASGGVLFERVYAPTSWTRPSIASLLTGREVRALGIYTVQREILADRFTTLAEHLQARGYATFGITANPHLNTTFNFQQGFDEYTNSTAGFSFANGAEGRRLPAYGKSSVRTAPSMFERARAFLEQHAGEPVYLQFNLMEVHEAEREFKHLTRDEFADLFSEHANAPYLRALRQLSSDLGAFAHELLARPGWEDALLVVTSDHGQGLDSHPDVAQSGAHGRLLYESQLRVPLILHRPGWELAGRRVARTARLLDVLPTVLDALGAPIPVGLDGVSLLPLARDPEAEVGLPAWVVAETTFRGHDKAAVYGDRWKYYEHYDEHPGTAPRELQAVGEAENGTRTNRIEDEEAVAREMARYLAQWKERHPRAPVTEQAGELSEEELEQLQAIGYVE